MRVLFLTHSFPRYQGDAPGSFLLRLAAALAGEDVEVHVVAPAARGLPERETIGGISVERFRYAPRQWETLAYTGNMAQDVARSWRSKAAMSGYITSGFVRTSSASRRFSADLIHAHWWLPSGLIARGAARMSRCPFITTLHGTDVRLAEKFPVSRPAFRGVMKASARVTAVSRWLAGEAGRLAPGLEAEVAPMPVATERFTPGGSRETGRILFAGRLNRQKGLDHLLRAFASMQRLALLDVVGEGSEAQSLRLLASQLGISDRITWHGQVDQQELAAFYRAAAVLAVPSVDEGLGLVAAEALMCETPVIAFRSGGLPDVIDDGVTGTLVTPGDTAELARALDKVIESPGKAIAMGKAGHRFAAATFSPEAAARRYSTIYREVVAAHAA